MKNVLMRDCNFIRIIFGRLSVPSFLNFCLFCSSLLCCVFFCGSRCALCLLPFIIVIWSNFGCTFTLVPKCCCAVFIALGGNTPCCDCHTWVNSCPSTWVIQLLKWQPACSALTAFLQRSVGFPLVEETSFSLRNSRHSAQRTEDETEKRFLSNWRK